MKADAFAEFHNKLKLDPDEVAFARNFPDEVRDALSAGGVVISNSFLQGSLARGTMVSPLKDVDMVVSLDREEHGYLLDRHVGPDQAMDMMERVLSQHLRSRYPDLRFGERTAHAITIELGNEYPSFDIVPAFETTTDDDDVLIAHREHGVWERSNPRALTRVVAEANQLVGGKLIHVIRMTKHTARVNLHPKFPGLAVEAIAMSAINELKAYDRACALVFAKAAAMLGGPIMEPTGLNDLAPKIEDLGPDFTVTAKRWFSDQAEDARRALLCTESGDHDQAVAWWHRIFGPPFPAPPADVSSQAAASALTYGATSARPVRAWRRSV